ncbi:MAG: hypothetical protein K8M05_24455 [Deltaproteobacteria bacterium]|nr:hypothetical protein [Kofleriaceae bacterium]
MRRVVVCFSVAAGVAGAAASAAAQPTPAPAEPPVDAYPVEHAERPLLLPAGAIEGGARVDVYDYAFDGGGVELYQLVPGVRYGLANAEVEARATLGLGNSGEMIETEALQALALAGRLGLGERSAVGIELQSVYPGEDFRTTVIGAMVSTRRHFGGASLDLGAGAAYGLGSGETGIDTIRVHGTVTATAQLAPAVALQALARQYWFDYLGDPGFGLSPAYFGQDYGVRALFAATPALDVIAGMDVLSTGNDSAARLYTLGVAARRVP